ncbi:MAG: methyltransferase domain-containing protein [Gammaproteobacteria bacterium]|nr:methyltransferase domain-containing protein [Gammaproteobacteria bacterium]
MSAIDGFWRDSAAGRDLCRLETEALEGLQDRLYGQFMLQVGCLGQGCPPPRFRGLRQQFILSAGAASGCSLLGEMARWPIASSSVNAVYLPHVLEFVADPHGLLREADRSLIPDGRLLISLFNPFSQFGIRRLFGGSYPWSGHFISPGRLNDWLRLLGFELEQVIHLGQRPPLQRQMLYNRFALMDRLGQRFWPGFGGVYMVLAVKREVPMTLLRPSWKNKRGFVHQGGIAEPTTRSDQGV